MVGEIKECKLVLFGKDYPIKIVNGGKLFLQNMAFGEAIPLENPDNLNTKVQFEMKIIEGNESHEEFVSQLDAACKAEFNGQMEALKAKQEAAKKES
jgi:hypothetical protein